MLDYDSMRSKVKKLTEKPDKDPSKLPRTEKETEMVKKLSLHSSRIDDLVSTAVAEDDLLFPSPPKALVGINRHRGTLDRIKADEEAALQSVGLKRKSSIIGRLSRVGSLVGSAFASGPTGNVALEKRLAAPPSPSSMPSPGASSPSPTVRSKKGSWASHRELANPSNSPTLKEILEEGPPESPTRSKPKLKLSSRFSASPRPTSTLFSGAATFSARGGGMIPPTSPHSTFDAGHHSMQPNTPKRIVSTQSTSFRNKTSGTPPSRITLTSQRSSDLPSVRRSLAESKRSGTSPTPSRNIGRTALFHPSELEDIMQPLKQEYIAAKTDELKQAKAAYEQLNTQLTDELPQLIDLR